MLRLTGVLGAVALLACRPAQSTSPPSEPDPAPSPDVAEAEPSRPESEPQPAETATPQCPGAPECSDLEPVKVTDEVLARARKLQPIVHRAAAEYGVDPNLINAVIWHESKFNPRARGPAGARGLMQLMPRTSKSLARKLQRRHRPYDPEFNIFAGTHYLGRLIDRFDGDERLALAGYARGGGRVAAWVENGEPIPERTQRFIAKVMRAKATFATLFEPQPAA